MGIRRPSVRSGPEGFARLRRGQIPRIEGLVSADRSEAAALLGTTPRSIPKSSTSDLASRSKRRKGFRAELPGRQLGAAGGGVGGIGPAPHGKGVAGEALARAALGRDAGGVAAHRQGFRLRGVQP